MSDFRDSAFCDRAMDGWLGDSERAALTGWTGRVTRALAHLADAWTIADGTNAPRAALAIACLIVASRSDSQLDTWRAFVSDCAGGDEKYGGRGTELLGEVDRALRFLERVS